MPTPLRKPTAERRREIGEAALRIAGLRGVTALTTSNLAEEVGVTTGALFRHFPTLDDVLREAVRLGLEKMAATFPDAGLPPLERIGALARNRVAVLSRDPGLAWLVRSDQAALMLPDDAVSALLEFVDRSRRFFLEALRQGVVEGSVRQVEGPLQLTARLVRADTGLVVWSKTYRTSVANLDVVEVEITTEVARAASGG